MRQPEFWQRCTMLEIAIQLHMNNLGSNPDLRPEDYASGLNYLKQRLAQWKPTDRYGNPDFDLACLKLIEITIIECELMKIDPEYLIKRRS